LAREPQRAPASARPRDPGTDAAARLAPRSAAFGQDEGGDSFECVHVVFVRLMSLDLNAVTLFEKIDQLQSRYRIENTAADQRRGRGKRAGILAGEKFIDEEIAHRGFDFVAIWHSSSDFVAPGDNCAHLVASNLPPRRLRFPLATEAQQQIEDAAMT